MERSSLQMRFHRIHVVCGIKRPMKKLDKDRFRRDMGNVEDAYQEVFRRIGIK